MRKSILLAAMLGALTLAATARAQQAPALHGIPYASAYYTFPVISAVGQTAYIDFSAAIFPTHTLDVSIGTGTDSACTFNVQGSSDLVNWYDLSGPENCGAPLMFNILNKPVRYMRVNLSAYTGTAPLTFHYTGAR